MRSTFIFATLVYSSLTFAERFNPTNDPNNFSVIVEAPLNLVLAELPETGALNDPRIGWSDSYWPSYKGGITFRWNHPDPMPFRYAFHTLAELRRMSLDELSTLSPAELYDIAMGDYQYTLTRRVLAMTSPRDIWWEGICHGWAQAAANYPEPGKNIITNPQGLRVPFGSSDVKALLSMHDAYNSIGEYARVGERCEVAGKVPGEATLRDRNPQMPAPELAETEECRDVNAGAFHVVLTNMIGIFSRSFVADIDRFNDVWNQPVTSFQSMLLGEEELTEDHLAVGIVRRVRVVTTMTYGEELQFWSAEKEARGERNFVSKEPVTGTIHQAFRSKDYEYVLELDQQGQIVGGEWITLTRPDFLWAKRRDPRFINGRVPLAGLNLIYRPVRR
jgi:hypothetical protein